MRAFEPLTTNPHLQTILGHYWPRDGGEKRWPVKRRLYRTEPDVQVLVESQQPDQPRSHMLLVHGLEGASDSGYMRSLSGAALRAGWAAHRFNLRTCGGTQNLCRTLYHAGLTSDLLSVLREFEREGRTPAVLVGFSLGGNVVLKLAGELGSEAGRWIRGVCAVSTPLDLGACARRIGEPDNALYHRRFVRRMKQRLHSTGRYGPADFERLRTLIEIDDRITAPSFGFGNAENYYATQSCRRFLARIDVPGLLIVAQDDTFVPFDIYRDEGVSENPRLRLIAPEYGGHMGFLARKQPRFWIDGVIVEWADGLV